MPVICCSHLAVAQAIYPKFEVFGGYSAIETNDHTFQFTDLGPVGHLDFDERGKGFETAVIGNVNRYIGIMGDFSAHFSSNEFAVPFTASTQPGSINPRLFNFLAGPELKLRNHTRFTPFVHALVGVAHSSATFNTAGSIINLSRTDADTGFAVAYGGGLDIRILRRLSFRGFLTYNQTSVDHQKVNSLGWSSGILLH
jgi:hypothetical protein